MIWITKINVVKYFTYIKVRVMSKKEYLPKMEKFRVKSLHTSSRVLSVLIGLVFGNFVTLAFAQAPSTQQMQQQIQSLQNLTPQQQQQLQTLSQQYKASQNQNSNIGALQQAQLAGPNQGQVTSPAIGALQGTLNNANPNAQANAPQSNQNVATTANVANATQPLTAGQAPSAVASLSINQPTTAVIPPPPAPTTSVASAPPPPSSATVPAGKPNAPAQPPAPNFTPAQLNDAAFSATVDATLPMSPDQIQKLRSLYQASQYAASSTPDTPPRPTATSLFVDLSPGATPPVIRLSQGFITSLVFLDSTGAPWPIEAYDVGNPQAFNIQWDKTTNTMMVQSLTMYNYGNLAVRLRGLPTPIMLTLIPGQKAVDYRVDLRVQGYGPNAQALPSGNGLPNSADPSLLGVLDGVPPDGSRLLSITGGVAQAWISGSNLYVRTRLDVISPGWIGTMSSADGMHAYVMQPTPVLLVSQNGRVQQLRVEGF